MNIFGVKKRANTNTNIFRLKKKGKYKYKYEYLDWYSQNEYRYKYLSHTVPNRDLPKPNTPSNNDIFGFIF